MPYSKKFESLEARQLLTITALDTVVGGPLDFGARSFASSEERAYFSLQNDEGGQSLWTGEKNSVRAVTDNGNPVSSFFELEVVGESAFYTATVQTDDGDDDNPFGLFRFGLFYSDDDSESPVELSSEEMMIRAQSLTPMDDGVLFYDATTSALWTSDGTREGTRQVSDVVQPRPRGLTDYQFTPVGDQVWITEAGQGEVWSWDSDTELFTIVGDFSDDSRFSNVEVRSLHDEPWLRVVGESGSQLWRFDNNTDEFALVKEFPNTFLSWNDVVELGENALAFTVAEQLDPAAISSYVSNEFTNRQLWYSDGTTEGTKALPIETGRMVVELAPIAGGLAYVQLAEDGDYDLWQIDPNTDSSPERVHEFARVVTQFEDSLVAAGGSLFFTDGQDLPGGEEFVYRYHADSGVETIQVFEAGVQSSIQPFAEGFYYNTLSQEDVELWFYDASSKQLDLVHESEVTVAFSGIRNLMATEDHLLFSTSQSGGEILWARDFRGETIALAETGFSPILTSPDGTPFQEEVSSFSFFNSQSTWVTDFTRAGTYFDSYDQRANLGNSTPGTGLPFPVEPVQSGETTYSVQSTPELGPELWATRDGESRLVKDILPGEFGSYPRDLAVFDDIVYFSARDRTTIYRFGDIEVEAEENWELWRSDGTSEGTYKLLEINPAPEAFPVSTSSSQPSEFTAVARGFIFTAIYDGFARFSGAGQGRGWFSSDGTVEGTFRLEVLDGLELVTTLNEQPIFLGRSGVWTTDGTEEGTVQFHTFDSSGGELDISIVRNRGLEATADAIVFQIVQDDELTLWQIDTDSDGNPQVVLIATFPNVSNFQILPFYDQQTDTPVLFLSNKTDEGIEVWATRETPTKIWSTELDEEQLANTRVNTTQPNPNSIYVRAGTDEVISFNGLSLFSVFSFQISDDGQPQFESTAWATDGTAENTFEVESIARLPTEWQFVDDQLYFQAEHPDHGRELWVSDGTTDGTYLYDIAPGIGSSLPGQFVQWRNEHYFTAGGQLWKLGVCELEGDINDDQIVDFADFLAVSSNFGKEGASKADGDVNGDGIIDFADFLAISFNFGVKQQDANETLEPTQQLSPDYVEEIYARLKLRSDQF